MSDIHEDQEFAALMRAYVPEPADSGFSRKLMTRIRLQSRMRDIMVFFALGLGLAVLVKLWPDISAVMAGVAVPEASAIDTPTLATFMTSMWGMVIMGVAGTLGGTGLILALSSD